MISLAMIAVLPWGCGWGQARGGSVRYRLGPLVCSSNFPRRMGLSRLQVPAVHLGHDLIQCAGKEHLSAFPGDQPERGAIGPGAHLTRTRTSCDVPLAMVSVSMNTPIAM